MAYHRNERGFEPDEELSELFTRLWDMDDNKCYPGQDFEINLQGYVRNPRELQEDRARGNLFEWVSDEVFERPTYKNRQQKLFTDAQSGAIENQMYS